MQYCTKFMGASEVKKGVNIVYRLDKGNAL